MFKKSAPKRLETAKADLQAAEAKSAQVAAAEDAALETAEAHVAWRKQRDDAAAEVSRLQRLITIIEAEVADEKLKAAAALQAKIEADANAAAEQAARAVASNMQALSKLVRETLRLIAEADVVVAKANASRDRDLPPLLGVEQRARGGQRTDRKILSDRPIECWVFASSGNRLSPEQEAQIVEDAGKSVLITETPLGDRIEVRHHQVVRRRFRRIEFLPPQRPRLEPLATAMNVPAVIAGDPPVWTPMREGTRPADVLARLQALAASASAAPSHHASPEVEFVAIDAADADAAA